MNESETRAELIDPKLMEAVEELTSPEGAEYVNDGCSPSIKNRKSITSPEGA